MSKTTNATVKRNKEENAEFYDAIESIIDNAKYAIGMISYSAFPEINKDIINEIAKACEILDNVLVHVDDIEKPV